MRLSAYLEKHDKTVPEFAAEIGAERSTAWKWARGLRVPRPKWIAKIEKATGGKVRANDFFETRAA